MFRHKPAGGGGRFMPKHNGMMISFMFIHGGVGCFFSWVFMGVMDIHEGIGCWVYGHG